jgi:hypothetical protein
VRALLVETKLEEDTRVAAPKRRLQMQNARSRFINACGFPSSSEFTPLSGRATVTGVGFFGSIHGQTGVAPNGIELHPVLAFTRTRCH